MQWFLPSVSLVNKAVVDYFFVELGVEGHFEALRHFLLMEDGEFAQSLSDLLFEKVKVYSCLHSEQCFLAVCLLDFNVSLTNCRGISGREMAGGVAQLEARFKPITSKPLFFSRYSSMWNLRRYDFRRRDKSAVTLFVPLYRESSRSLSGVVVLIASYWGFRT